MLQFSIWGSFFLEEKESSGLGPGALSFWKKKKVLVWVQGIGLKFGFFWGFFRSFLDGRIEKLMGFGIVIYLCAFSVSKFEKLC